MLTVAKTHELRPFAYHTRYTRDTFANEKLEQFSKLLEAQVEQALEQPISRLNEAKIDLPIGDIAYAIKEALINAYNYGILELDSSIRDQENGEEKFEAARIRALKLPNSHSITLDLDLNKERLKVVVKQDGKGFDPLATFQNIEEAGVFKTHGRGYNTYIKGIAFPDSETGFSRDGKTLTMVRRLS